MSDKEKRKTEEEKIEPFVVPEDWEPADGVVKKIRELTSWIPEELGKKWWDEIQEEHRISSDRRGAMWKTERERIRQDNGMSDRKSEMEEEKIEPFVVPEDWEPTETVKKMRELVSWIPDELKKKWLEEIREEHRKSK